MAENIIRLPRAESPESVGVSSREIARFLQEIKDFGYRFHSFMVIRHGKVAVECYRDPYRADIPHQMYSVSKSLTSTAIGFAVEEGLLSLEDRLVDIFPDHVPEQADERLPKLRVKHLLNMTSGKSVSLLDDKTKNSWVASYMKAPWYADPGEKFKYVNENIYMLCAILHRVTGMTVREFLQPRLFEPLGIACPQWETDPYGIEAGGWGVFLTTEDLAKIMLMYHQGGVFNGKRILSEEWVKTATSIQSDNSANEGIDSSCGYGYCFWRCHQPETYRADGMFSQFGIVFGEYDALLICTAGICSEDTARAMLWHHFPRAFIDENAPKADTTCDRLQELLNNTPMDVPFPASSSPWEHRLEGSVIRLRKNILLNLVGFPVSMLPLAVVYMSADKAGNIDNIRFSFKEHECAMRWTEGDEENTVLCGMDGHFRYGTMRLGQLDFTVCCSAYWNEVNNLVVDVRPVNTIGKRRLSFRFNLNGRVTVKPSGEPSSREISDYLASGVHTMFSNPVVITLAKFALSLLPPIIEPKMRGRLIKED